MATLLADCAVYQMKRAKWSSIGTWVFAEKAQQGSSRTRRYSHEGRPVCYFQIFPLPNRAFSSRHPRAAHSRASVDAAWRHCGAGPRAGPHLHPPYPSLYNCNFWQACVELQPALVPSPAAPGQSPRGCPCSTEDREWTSNSVAWSGCGMIYRESLRRL